MYIYSSSVTVALVRNVTGSPVENDDFFDRPRDLSRLRREIDNGANILLTAPRRVGKTSVALRLCELERRAGRSAIFMNVEGCHDELAFAEKLIDGLTQSGLHPEPLSRISLLFRKARQALTGFKVGAAGVDLEMGSADDPDHAPSAERSRASFGRSKPKGNDCCS